MSEINEELISAYLDHELSKEERELLEKLRDSENFNPDADHQERGFFDKVRDMFT